MHHFVAFGLRIASDIPCPECLPCDGAATDVRIRLGPVPTELASPIRRGGLYQVDADRFLFQVNCIARFLVTGGREVLVDPCPGAGDGDVRVFLLGSVMGALLYQRGILPLHGSAIETARGAVMFLGHSGCGKSTLAATFHKRAYRILTDDVCAIAADGQGMPVLIPSYPRVSLWHDAVQELGESHETLRRLRPALEKYALPVGAGFDASPVPVFAAYELCVGNRDELCLEAVRGAGKLGTFTRHAYRLRFLEGMNGRDRHFKMSASLGRRLRVGRLTRPRKGFRLQELADLLREDFDR